MATRKWAADQLIQPLTPAAEIGGFDPVSVPPTNMPTPRAGLAVAVVGNGAANHDILRAPFNRWRVENERVLR